MATIQDLYGTILNRTPNSSETSYWQGQFGSASPTSSNANAFWNAAQPELQQKAANWAGGSVSDLYSQFLGLS